MRRILFLALVVAGRGMYATDLELRVSLRWRGGDIAIPSESVVNRAGQRLRFTRLSVLVSEVSLFRADGGIVRLDGQFGWVDVGEGRRSIQLRNVPAGDYAGLAFRIGLSPAINHADPSNWPAGHPLNPMVNRLHWGWQGGYVFLALEGRWTQPGGEESGFSYHLATDEHVMSARFLAPFTIVDNAGVDLAFDLERVLGDIELRAGGETETTHSASGDALAARLANAVARAWFWLGAGEVQASASAAARTSAPEGLSQYARAAAATPLAFTVPAGFPQPALPADNPFTAEGVALGEVLFHDTRLSGNGSQSCASCHAPANAFSDSVALSRGADGATGMRNAQPLFNLAWSPAFAWDGCQPRIRDQALAAWTNPVEMHGDPAQVVDALVADARLTALFAGAFGDSQVTVDRITRALEQYLLTLVAADSKFDRAARGEAGLTEEEMRGFQLFVTEYDPVRGRNGADCFHCHGGPLFSDFGYRSNGLDSGEHDAGRATVTADPRDAGKFKTPSLRNVARTAPYMHDGRFATVEDVIAHYDHGVVRTPALDPNLAKHPSEGLRLSDEDQRALVAFLRTLTDASFEPAIDRVASTSRGAAQAVVDRQTQR